MTRRLRGGAGRLPARSHLGLRIALRAAGIAALAMALLPVAASAASVSLVSRFGRAEIDTARPSLTALWLRRPGGALEPHSILAPVGSPWPRGVANWGEGGYTYVVDASGRRYESRYAPARSVQRTGGRLVLQGIQLAPAPGAPAVAEERWVFSTAGGALAWTVERRWLRPFTARLAATPGLFSSFRRCTDTQLLPNSVTHTLWVRPADLRSWFEPAYRDWPADYKMSLENSAVVTTPNTWAVAKLWTSWHAQSDPRLAVKGGHLFRRGFFGWRSEVGAVSSPDLPRRYAPGQIERVTLTVDTVDKRSTGYQLRTDIPDKAVEDTIESFYGSLLNGGVVNDQKHYDFGNETDGWYYDGSAWMQGLALSAGVPAAGRLASNPFDAASAFRGHLAAIVGTVNAQGVGNFGYDWTGRFADARLNTVVGAREYLMHTGDLPFARQILPDLERGVGWFLARRNRSGLVDLGAAGHWYYDAMPSSGVNAYHNALLYRACRCLAEMERAAGFGARARLYGRAADAVKAAFSSALWDEDAPGGPRLTDWIAHSGERVRYAADVCQFPAAAFGMLTKERARRLLATLDRRAADLARTYGYTGTASLSAYWPVPDPINTLAWQRPFPVYMNGGSFLAITYYEIMARIEAGDVDGAWDRMRRWSEGIRRHSGAGNNWVTVTGEVAAGADEPYLSDMVVVPAALARGFLGIEPTWDRLVIRPHLPRGWKRATADVMYKGIVHRVVISGGRTSITLGYRAFTPPGILTWEVRSAVPSQWQMTISRHFANGATPPEFGASIEVDGGRHIALGRERPARGLVGHWPMGRTPGVRVEGPVSFGQRGPLPGMPAAAFTGNAHLWVPDATSYSFGPRQSCTLQCWFRTGARDSRVMVSRPEAYCLYVKEGRLAAWVMQADRQYREARGRAVAADGAWHHAAAVFDRVTQRLSLYLDGMLDTEDGRPSAVNPVDIAPIGAAASAAPLSIGGLGAGFAFVGALADVRVHAGALSPAGFSYPEARREVQPVARVAASGAYLSSLCDWGQAVTLRAAVVDCSSNRGTLGAVVECSADGFRTVGRRVALSLRAGRHVVPLRCGTWRYARVRFRLRASGDRTRSPEVRYLELSGEPRVVTRTRRASR